MILNTIEQWKFRNVGKTGADSLAERTATIFVETSSCPVTRTQLVLVDCFWLTLTSWNIMLPRLSGAPGPMKSLSHPK